MIFPDLNLLIYAHNVAAPHHERAIEWLESVMNGEQKVCFCWHTILGFIRITTTPSMFPQHFTNSAAISIANELMSSQNSIMLSPGERHFSIFTKLINETGFSGPKISDVHLAALAMEHSVTFASSDRDFRYFEGLKLIDPLATERLTDA